MEASFMTSLHNGHFKPSGTSADFVLSVVGTFSISFKNVDLNWKDKIFKRSIRFKWQYPDFIILITSLSVSTGPIGSYMHTSVIMKLDPLREDSTFSKEETDSGLVIFTQNLKIEYRQSWDQQKQPKENWKKLTDPVE